MKEWWEQENRQWYGEIPDDSHLKNQLNLFLKNEWSLARSSFAMYIMMGGVKKKSVV